MLMLCFDREFKKLKNEVIRHGFYSPEFDKTYTRAKAGFAREQYELGCVCRDIGDRKNAFTWFLKSAGHDYAKAEYAIAEEIYENGPVSAEDTTGYSSYYDDPTIWLEKAWQHGLADAAALIARHYATAQKPDIEKAVNWYICSEERGGACDMRLVADYLADNGEHARALEYYKKDAGRGSRSSMLEAGAYLCGKKAADGKIAVDFAGAADYFEKACAVSEDADTLFLLGSCREKSGDDVGAFESYSKAAALLDGKTEPALVRAVYEKLGDLTYEGRGTKQSYPACVAFYEKAGDLQSKVSRLHLADCKFRGLGTERDVEAAAGLGMPEAMYKMVSESGTGAPELLKSAAAEGFAPARYDLGKECFGNKKYGEAIAELLPVAGEYDDVPFMLGVSFLKTGSPSQALSWLEHAAEKGDSEAECLIGRMYAVGAGVEKNDRKAVEWYKKSAAGGNINGAYSLGMCCKNGTGTAKNPARAMILISAAAENGNPEAMYEIANCMRLGSGTEQNRNGAIEYYMKSAGLGYEPAMYQTGFLYELGFITDRREPEKALEWYKKCSKDYKDIVARISACALEIANKK